MKRGTTPDYILTIDGFDLTDMTVFVAIKQPYPGHRLIKTNKDLSIAADENGSTIAFSLTQVETLLFDVGPAEIQVRFIDQNGKAYATEIGHVSVGRVLQEGVIAYERYD